jgi:hypothetical protein
MSNKNGILEGWNKKSTSSIIHNGIDKKTMDDGRTIQSKEYMMCIERECTKP